MSHSFKFLGVFVFLSVVLSMGLWFGSIRMTHQAEHFSDNFVRTFFENWDTDFLKENIDPQVANGKYWEDIAFYFQSNKKIFGPFVSYTGSKGHIFYEGTKGIYVKLSGKLMFEHCSADLDITLLYQNKEWRLAKLYIPSINNIH